MATTVTAAQVRSHYLGKQQQQQQASNRSSSSSSRRPRLAIQTTTIHSHANKKQNNMLPHVHEEKQDSPLDDDPMDDPHAAAGGTLDWEVQVPSEVELTLLCLDYLQGVRRSYPPSALQVVGLDADYLTLACWSLSQALHHGGELTVPHDCHLTSSTNKTTTPPLDPTDYKSSLPDSFDTVEETVLLQGVDHNHNDDDEETSPTGLPVAYEYDDAHASNANRFYLLAGLDSGPHLAGPLGLAQVASAGLRHLQARTRLEAERDMIQSPLFSQFVQAVHAKGFFETTTTTNDESTVDPQRLYEERYAKVVAKFRTKLATKAVVEQQRSPAVTMAAACAEQVRQRRLWALSQQQATAVTGQEEPTRRLKSSDKNDDNKNQTEEVPTPASYLQSSFLSSKWFQPPTTSYPRAESEAYTDYTDASENPEDLQQAEKLKNKGNTHMQRKEYKLAQEAYTQALKLSPAGPQSHVYFSNRAAAMVSLKDYPAAILDSERSLAMKPDYGKAHARLGLAHFLLGNYRQAMEAYTVSLKYEPDNRSSKNYLEKAAKRLAEQQQHDSSKKSKSSSDQMASFSVVSEWEKTKQQQPHESPSRNNTSTTNSNSANEKEAERFKIKGNSAMALREYDQALEAYTKALDLCPTGTNSHVYYSNRAAALCYLERYKEAEADSMHSLQLNPHYGKAHARLGLSRFFLQDYAGAVQAYTAALEQDPDNAASQSYLQKAKAKLASSQSDAAARLVSDPDFRKATEHIAAAAASGQSSAQLLADNPDLQAIAKKATADPTLLAALRSHRK